MFGYASITNEKVPLRPTRVCVSEMHPFDGMRFVLEQAIYYDYLKRMTNDEGPTLREFKRCIQRYELEMAPRLPFDEEHLSSLFTYGKRLISDILQGDKLYLIDARDLLVVFNRTPIREYKHNTNLSLNETFLLQWMAMNGYCDTSKYDDSIIRNCALFIPSISVYTDVMLPDNTNEFHVDDKNPNLFTDRLHIALSPRAMNAFDCRAANSDIFAFDMCNYDLNDVVAFKAAFCLDHDNIMSESISKLCYDIITDLSVTHDPSLGSSAMVTSFLDQIRSHISCGKLQHFRKDRGVFEQLLIRAGVQQEIINGLVNLSKPPTAASATLIRESGLAFFVPDYAHVGLAAIDDGDPGDLNTDREKEEDDLDLDNQDESNIEESAETNKPHIDPDMMLLQLAKPDENMSDYLFRSVVAFRINALINNPPKNALPAEILMLKRWRSRWLYLASLSCLRDFLSRLSVRLSDF